MPSCRAAIHPFVLLLLASTTGCGEEEPTKYLEVATTEEALIGGSLDSGHPSVGSIGADACTATLIGEKTLLLAAHCVDPGEKVGFCTTQGCNAAPNGFGFAVRNPNFAPSWSDANDFGDDIAIVKLQQPFPFGPPTPISAGNQLTPFGGMPVTLVGTGCTDAATQTGAGPKRSGNTTVSDVAGDNTFRTNGPPTSCSGDSGGPVFYQYEACQVGVMVGATGSTSIATRVDTKRSWILSEANDPTIQTCSTCKLAGSPCAINGDCCSGSCHCTFACGTSHPVSACE
jgi:hypothetical protein